MIQWRERRDRCPKRAQLKTFSMLRTVLPDSRGGLTVDLNEEAQFPWEKPSLELKEGGGERRKRSKTTLPEGELKRLRHLAIRTNSKTKTKGAGVTKEIVDLIHERSGGLRRW
ncbi:uncharacterized protein A4U43_C08F20140 [Asparagus officinalis]|nr:uncharacterized protein A4U43_C08F20140 [Asparagus officinalis]